MSRVVNEPEAARKLSVSVPKALWAQAERLYATDAKNRSASQVVQAALRVALSVLETDENDLSRARFSPAWLAGVDDGVDDVLVEIEAAVEARSGAETAPQLRDGQGDGHDAT